MSNGIVVFCFCEYVQYICVGTGRHSSCRLFNVLPRLTSNKVKTVTHVDLYEAGTWQHNHCVYRRGVIIKNVCLSLCFPAEHVRLSEDKKGWRGGACLHQTDQ